MKIAGNQSYFFPYLGYFSLINQADLFIIFDSDQYIRRGWINRNRILHPAEEGSLYIRVPIIKAPVEALIRDIQINNQMDWKSKIIAQMQPYKKLAPNYREVMSFLDDCFSYETDSISKLNTHLLKKTCSYLEIPHSIIDVEDLGVDVIQNNVDGEWGVHYAKALHADTVFNLPSGSTFYNEEVYLQNGVEIQFLQNNLRAYDQKREKFEPGLSILDVMMFNSIGEIHDMLKDYRVVNEKKQISLVV